jgi:hypothetical protein
LTGFVPFAKETIVGMIGEEQFDDHSSGIYNAVGLGFDLHSCTYGKGARWYETSLSFDFDDADTAGSSGRKSLVIAEGGDIDSDAAQSGEEHFAVGGINLATIDFDLDGMGHCLETRKGKCKGGHCTAIGEKLQVVYGHRVPASFANTSPLFIIC